MKSCLALMFVSLLALLLIGGGALFWYLSDTAEFTRADSPAPSADRSR